MECRWWWWNEIEQKVLPRNIWSTCDISKGKRIVSKGKKEGIGEKYRRRHKNGDDGIRHENDQFETVQGTERTSTCGAYWTHKQGGKRDQLVNGHFFSNGGWDRYAKDPIEDKADDTDDKGSNYLIWKIQRRRRRRTKLRGRGFFHHRARTRGSFQHGNCQKGQGKENKLLFGVTRLSVFSKAGNRTTREMKWRTKRIERTWVWLMMTVWMKSSND